MPKISVVTAFYNEAENLPHLRRRLTAAFAELGSDYEIVLVDDHSSDGSQDLAREWVIEDPNVRYLRLSRNFGAHAAFAAGLRYCTGDCAVALASDLQDPPETIPELVSAWREGYDVVWAVRSQREGESWSTKLFAAVYYRLMRRLALPDMPAKGADFLLVDRQVIDAFKRVPEKNTNFLAIIIWMGFRQTSIEYVKEARQGGTSKWTLAKKIKLFVDSIVSFSYAPIRMMSWLGLLMATVGFVYAAVVVFGWVFGRVQAATGFAALMTVLLIGQGTIMCMLGVLGEYLWRAFDEARGRPTYIVEEWLGDPLHERQLARADGLPDSPVDNNQLDRRHLTEKAEVR
jgi:dolichol-phosphate mannosyltransferase